MIRMEGEITPKKIQKCIQRYEQENQARYAKFQSYYEGKNDILFRQMMGGNDVNNKVANNYAGYITDMATGYFIGRPVSYSGEEAFLAAVQDIYNYNDEQDENSEIAKQASIKGRCYEVVYLDANDLGEDGKPRLRFNKINAEEMLVAYDYGISPEMTCAIRWYEVEDEDGRKFRRIEVYTKERILTYDRKGGTLKKVREDQHFFKIVPVIEYLNNEEAQGDFEKVLTLIDAYDKSCSDALNNLEYFANCYMYLVNMKDTREEEIRRMKEMRVLLFDEKGEAGFLTKDENSEGSENIANRLKSDIHKFAMVPDLSDEQFAASASGIAMLYKLLGLEQLAVKKERKMKKGLQRRLEIIANYLNLRGQHFDYRDIQMKFVRNIPVNEKENVEIVQLLQGILSKKTALSYLKMVDDVNQELQNIEEEKQAYADLDTLMIGEQDA
ncbi:MAG: phage portal protein [Peptostreptococcaceae bacterium]|nr:phage portal protein [Peptostreptococcaceae bacterium]